MKQSLIILIVLLLSSFGAPASFAQPAPIPSVPLPPTSIRLTAIPGQLPPGGSGVVIVQLVDSNGNPSPARSGVTVSLFSSDPTVLGVSQQVAIAFGKSHAEAQAKAGVQGAATVTAIASGFFAGSTKVSTSIFSDFALQLVPLNNPVSPGDSLELRVGLMAAGKPFDATTTVQVSVTTSLPGIAQQAIQIQPGSCCAYANIPVPANVPLQTTRFMTVTAAAPGFTSASAGIGLSAQGTNPQEVLVGPSKVNLTAGNKQFLSVALFNGSFAPSRGSITLDLFSSNSSVVEPLLSQVSTDGGDSATFQVLANATGTAQITAVAPGLPSLPLIVTVVEPFRPALRLSLPSEVRVGEVYSFSVGFYDGSRPIPYGPADVYLSSSDAEAAVPSTVEASALGFGIGSFSAKNAGVANITAVLEGLVATTMTVDSMLVPVVAPVKYVVTIKSDSGPLVGIPVNFMYGGRNSAVITDLSGEAGFAAYNDTTTLATVPSSVTLSNRTYFFTGWGNGVKTENASLLASNPVYPITAQYFRSVVPTTYSLLALSDGQEPVAGLRFNVSSKALQQNFTLITNSRGIAYFVLPNESSFMVSVPKLFQPSGQARYAFLSVENSTRNLVNITAHVGITISTRYATYYHFQVTSPIGSTNGSEWYRSGSTAPYSISETSSGGPLVFQRFAGWTGSISSSQPSGSTAIASPEFITAQWSTDNSLLFAVAGGVIAAAALTGLFIFRLRKKAPPS